MSLPSNWLNYVIIMPPVIWTLLYPFYERRRRVALLTPLLNSPDFEPSSFERLSNPERFDDNLRCWHSLIKWSRILRSFYVCNGPVTLSGVLCSGDSQSLWLRERLRCAHSNRNVQTVYFNQLDIRWKQKENGSVTFSQTECNLKF